MRLFPMDDEHKRHQRCCHHVSINLLDKTSVLQPEATETLVLIYLEHGSLARWPTK